MEQKNFFFGGFSERKDGVMRNKKALAILLAVSMVFSLNLSAFAANVSDVVEVAEEDDSQSVNSSNSKKATISDNNPTNNIIIDTKTLNAVSGNEETEIILKSGSVTLPQSVLKELIAAADGKNVVVNIGTTDLDENDANSIVEKYSVSAADITQLVSIDIIAGTEEFKWESGNIDISINANTDTQALKTAYIYCLSTDPVEKTGTDDVTDGTADWSTSHLSSYIFASEAEALGEWDVTFDTYNALVVSGDDMYKMYKETDKATNKVTRGVYLYDEDDEYNSEGIKLTANAANSFTITAPYVHSHGVAKVVKWVELDAGSFIRDENSDYVAFTDNVINSAAMGASVTLDTIYDEESYTKTYYPVVELLNETIDTEVSANGHTINVEIAKTPAYTGKKMSAGYLLGAVTVDGKAIDPSLVKLKVKGKKDVGSSVTVTLQKINGLDKDTNKALKGQSLGTATIRAIEASEATLWTGKYSQEGQVLVSLKNGAVKKIKAVVPKGKFKVNKNTGLFDAKARKLSIKKNKGYTYDSSTGYLTFDGTQLNGTIKVKITSK